MMLNQEIFMNPGRGWRKFASAACALAAGLCVAGFQAGGEAGAQTLDLSHYRMTFNEPFHRLNVSNHGPGSAWIAHTPWNGDFGDDTFDAPGPGGPFTASPQGLTITARKDGKGQWHTGLLCSLVPTPAGPSGFAQRYGYFEMKAKLPDGPGVWPAFWLVGTGPSKAPEIDVIEYYGAFRDAYRITEHLWTHNTDTLQLTTAVDVPPGSLSAGYNTFGVLIEAEKTIFYLNRKQVWSTPTPPQFRQPLYMLIDLAIGGGWPSDHLTSPQRLQVAYVRAYEPLAH
jgi:Glycosyl hydrolases family 16